MRRPLGIMVAAGVLLCGLACRSERPEARIRRAFETCRAAVEEGDAAAATAPLDAAFRGPDGMDRATAQLFLMATFRQEKVGVTVLRSELSVRGNEAIQEVDLLLTGRSGSVLPGEASRREFRLRWRRSGSDWRLAELENLEGR